MKYRQYKIKSAKVSRTVWLDDLKLKKGTKLTLTDDGVDKRWWTVIEIFSEIEAKDLKESHESKNWYKKDYLHKVGRRISKQ